MRLIGEIDNDQQAQLFASYLLTQGIESQVEVGDVCEIWAKDEDRLDKAVQELEQFKSDPTNSRYANSIQEAKVITRAEEKKRKRIQKKMIHVGARNMNRRPPLTLIMIGICAAVALLTEFGEASPAHPIYRALQFVYVGPPRSVELDNRHSTDGELNRDAMELRLASLTRGQIWRTVTPIFIHYGIMHILFNMYMFFQFGKLIENRFGTYKFASLVLATAVLSNLVQCLVPVSVGGSAPTAGGSEVGFILITQLGGMSGVVYGLFGFTWMKSTYDRTFGYRISESTIIILMVWFFLCIIPPQVLENAIGFRLGSGSVANWAHGIGLAVGLAVGYGTTMWKMRPRK